MSQNGPYPDGPGQPWSGDGSGEPYREPADPWGRWGAPPPFPDTGEKANAADQPGDGYPPPYAGTGYVRPAGEYGRPTPAPPTGRVPGAVPPRPRERRPPVVLLAVLSGVLVCAGLVATVWTLTREPAATSAAGPPVPTATTPAAPATTDNAVPPPPLNSKDARFVAKGQCVRNEGTADVPEMSISVCTSGAFEVLARFDGRTTGEADAETKCAKVQNYSKWYFYDSELDSLDFVLCLKER